MQQRLLTTPSQAVQALVSRRKARKITQGVVASRLGISQSRLSEIETRPETMTLDRLLAIAQMLELEIVIREKSEGVQSPLKSEW